MNHLFPAFSAEHAECGLQQDPLLFSCAGSSAKYQRLCPCRDYRNGQVALCRDCLWPGVDLWTESRVLATSWDSLCCQTQTMTLLPYLWPRGPAAKVGITSQGTAWLYFECGGFEASVWKVYMAALGPQSLQKSCWNVPLDGSVRLDHEQSKGKHWLKKKTCFKCLNFTSVFTQCCVNTYSIIVEFGYLY